MAKRKNKKNSLPYAYRLLTIAEHAAEPRGQVVVACPHCYTPDGLNEVKLAFDFARRDNLLKFRALVEGWDLSRILREMY